MVKVRARVSMQEEGDRLRVKVKPVNPLLFGGLALLLLAGFLVAGIPAGAFDPSNIPATLFYLLLILFLGGAAGFSRVTVADLTHGSFTRSLRLFGLRLPLGRLERELAELREVVLERIVLVNPRVPEQQGQWEHEGLRKPAALHRFSLQFPGKRIIIAESSVQEDLETIASYWAGFLGVSLDRRER